MKKLIEILLIIPIFSIGQTFEITKGQSMCMIGKGNGQDATINPYADEDYSYALIENIGLVEFQIRVDIKRGRYKVSTTIKKYKDEISKGIFRVPTATKDRISSGKKYTINMSKSLHKFILKKDKKW